MLCVSRAMGIPVTIRYFDGMGEVRGTTLANLILCIRCVGVDQENARVRIEWTNSDLL
jgi:hypothetical protein